MVKTEKWQGTGWTIVLLGCSVCGQIHKKCMERFQSHILIATMWGLADLSQENLSNSADIEAIHIRHPHKYVGFNPLVHFCLHLA